jgi:single stranded DNA-binding protein
MDINSITFSGHVGKDARIVQLPSGSTLAEFSVACNSVPKQDATWYNVRTYGQYDIKYVEQYAKKGAFVIVTGVHNSRQYINKAGVKSTVEEVKASSIKFPNAHPTTDNTDTENIDDLPF